MRVPPPGRRATYSPTRATMSVAARTSAIDSSRIRPATASLISPDAALPGARPLAVDPRPGAPPATRVVGPAPVAARGSVVVAPRIGPVLEGVAAAVVGTPGLLWPEHADRVPADREPPAEQGPDGPEEQHPPYHDAGDQPQQDHEGVHARVAEQVPVEAPPDHAHGIGARLLGQRWWERRKVPGQAVEIGRASCR